MAKFKIEYKGWQSLKEEFGDDVVFFDCDVYSGDDREHFFPIIYPFSYFKRYLEKIDPAMYSLVRQVEKQITGWGPHESVTITELGECGIDVGALVVKVVALKVDLERESLRWKNIESKPSTAEKIVDDLSEHIPAIKTETENYYQLCNSLEKVITEEVVKQFPVIMNSSSECIVKLREILIRHIPDIATDLNKLIREAEENKD